VLAPGIAATPAREVSTERNDRRLCQGFVINAFSFNVSFAPFHS
jgi:hypothetical protein